MKCTAIETIPFRIPCTVASTPIHQRSGLQAGELSSFLDRSDDFLIEPVRNDQGKLAVKPGPAPSRSTNRTSAATAPMHDH